MLFQRAVAANPQDQFVVARLADMRGHQQREVMVARQEALVSLLFLQKEKPP